MTDGSRLRMTVIRVGLVGHNRHSRERLKQYSATSKCNRCFLDDWIPDQRTQRFALVSDDC